jgi:uncharacterized protein YycO
LVVLKGGKQSIIMGIPDLKASESSPHPIHGRINAEPGDILLFTRPRRWSRLITWFTNSPYYHVALFRDGTEVVEARPRGVVSRDLNGPDGDSDFVVVPAPQGKGREALSWAERQIGDGYAVLEVFVLVLERIFKLLRIRFSERDRFSCGEFVARAYEQAGVALFPGRKLESLVPADFAQFLPSESKERTLDPATRVQVTLES